MRSLKFRAWDEIEEKYNNDTDIVMTLNGDYCVDKGCVRLFPKLTIEQYTGLKDKNGKEIYEGDIVDKAYNNGLIYNKNGVVEMGCLYDSDGYKNEEIYGWKAGDSSLADVCDGCKVIGNIHENKELLGGEE